jgi:hypothetical protein
MVNIPYRVFTLHKNYSYGAWNFLLCHDENFYFVSNASDESEYAMQKVNMGKY